MYLKRVLSVAVGLVVAAAGVVGVSQPALATPAGFPQVAVCTIQTENGYYLTAVGGGGRTTDAIHSDATAAGTWETFYLQHTAVGPNYVTLSAIHGGFLTAVGGGGRTTDTIHTNAQVDQAWEAFNLVPLDNYSNNGLSTHGWFAIQTYYGYYLTAVDGGGLTTDVIHTNATQVQVWEWFYFNCSNGHL